MVNFGDQCRMVIVSDSIGAGFVLSCGICNRSIDPRAVTP